MKVYEVGTTTETTLYTDRTKSTTTAQPISPDANGNLEFFADPGTYDLEVSIDGSVRSTNTVVVQPDGTEALDSIDQVFNVKTYGATGDGSTDDTTPITEAIDAANTAGGGVVFIPEGTYLVTASLPLYSDVHIVGSGWSSVIQGTGFPIILADGSSAAIRGCVVRDLKISDPTGDSLTVGIKLDGGSAKTQGVTDWLIDNVLIEGASGLGASNYLGIGVEMIFALKGVIRNSNIRFWNHGLDYEYASNANLIDGCKVRQNNTGFHVGETSGDVDTVPIQGCTIEGNDLGIDSWAELLQLTNNHLENNTGTTPTNVRVNVGFSMSVGNAYYAANSNRDIVIDSGSGGRHSSIGDILSNGITHNGTGPMWVTAAVTSFTTAGTGAVHVLNHAGRTGSNTSSLSVVLQGYSLWDLRNPLMNTNGPLDLRAATGQSVQLSDGSGVAKVKVDASGNLGFFNVTPVAQPSAYTSTNVVSDRSYDADATTTAELADVLGTLISDLQSLGLIG